MTRPQGLLCTCSAVFAVSMIAFGLVARASRLTPLGACGLTAAGLALGLGAFVAPSPRDLLWAAPVPVRSVGARITAFALGLGAWLALAGCYRVHLGLPSLPAHLTGFAGAAAAIGAAEELAYRGFVQGAWRPILGRGSLLVAALAHSAYKVALFVIPAGQVDTDLARLFAWTLAGSLALGLVRERLGLAPALVCHALFDVAVYGDRLAPPPWVWCG